MSDRVLFISGRCDHCKKILVCIQQHPFLKPLFKVVNVDVQPYPNYIKSVPSILINSQVISGQTVFEYFGKLVEGKKAQEQRIQENQTNESDQGQCRINEYGELEGYCGVGGLGGSGIGGNGGSGPPAVAVGTGTTNTGSGGCGGGNDTPNVAGAAGGSGIVIIRYKYQ